MKVVTTLLAAAAAAILPGLSSAAVSPPTIDLCADTSRHVIVARGTAQVYQGHPTTALLADGRTMFCVWTIGHGGSCGPLKRSDDGGRTWSELLPTPANWTTAFNCPALYRLAGPHGPERLFVFAGRGPDGAMQSAHSTDNGRTWTPMTGLGLRCVMPFCTIAPVEGGRRLLGMTNMRRPGERLDKKSNVIVQSWSDDGGATWAPWRVVLDLGRLKPCEPALVRSPDGCRLLCLLRENTERVSLGIASDDEGRTWSEPRPLPSGLHGDRHVARYAPDGRLVVCFRDTGKASPTRNHFVAWIGRWEDIVAGRDAQYRIKLLHSYKGSDCGYPGLELLPDGTFVATTYVKYRPGPEQHSVVSVRFNLRETDALVCRAPAPGGAGAASAPRPNVLFIAVDDLRPELGCYGARRIRSPHIDRLAARGVLFERAYCQQAVCNPSRASVLAGCRPDTTGVMANNRFLRASMPAIVTLPQHFKMAGWHSVSLGKIFHHSQREPGDDPRSWSEPSWYHAEPYRHWFTADSEAILARLGKTRAKGRARPVRGPALARRSPPPPDRA